GGYQLDTTSPIAIEADGLGFSYENRRVVEDLKFSIKPGDKVCITGRPGSGKSTLLKLLSGIYRDFEGKLLVNNIPIGNYDLITLREKMGILFQQENIFHGTLWENLTMGKPVTDRGFINTLCEKTGLLAFLAGQPAGYDTELDPAGKRLPRSVVQKILLVRALAHKPSLLIMEEPWQGIEEAHRRSIQDLVLKNDHSTVIVATTDESFSKRCNQIIYLES
ncbi:MAG: ATP-binding cassette domain-containing protein, partial [Flavisolibacter sp.]